MREGTLPPVDERLPENPQLVEPGERPGEYGGRWRMGALNVRDTGLFVRTVTCENLVSWDAEWTRVIPNIAQSVEVNDDATEYLFSLRKGMRWSDGHAFTTGDIAFYHRCTLDERLLPEHDPDIDAQAKEAGYDHWQHQFNYLSRPWNNPELPTLDAWLFTAAYLPGSEEPIVAERNPYYWKIDTSYRQLPYIDSLEFRLMPDALQIVEAAQAGEIDMQIRNIGMPCPETGSASSRIVSTTSPRSCPTPGPTRPRRRHGPVATRSSNPTGEGSGGVEKTTDALLDLLICSGLGLGVLGFDAASPRNDIPGVIARRRRERDTNALVTRRLCEESGGRSNESPSIVFLGDELIDVPDRQKDTIQMAVMLGGAVKRFRHAVRPFGEDSDLPIRGVQIDPFGIPIELEIEVEPRRPPVGAENW